MARQAFLSLILLVLMVTALGEGKSINIVPRMLNAEREKTKRTIANYDFVRFQDDVVVVWPPDGSHRRIVGPAPKGSAVRNGWKLFDNQKGTSFRTVPGWLPIIGHYFENEFRYQVKVTSYKIFVRENTPKEKHPRSWTVWGSKLNPNNGNYRRVVLDKVKDADFDLLYRGKIKNPGQGYDRIDLEITDDNSPGDAPLVDIEMAEVRFIGPSNQFDKHVNGGLKCPKTPQYPVTKTVKKGTPFSNDDAIPLKKLRYFFNNEWKNGHEVAVKYPDVKDDPLIIGTVLVQPIEVLQFGIEALVLRPPPTYGFGVGTWFENQIVLEGHKCDPSCDQLGDDGWEVLASGLGKEHYARKWLVQSPGAYKGYRVKMYRSPYERNNWKLGDLRISEVFLMVCR